MHPRCLSIPAIPLERHPTDIEYLTTDLGYSVARVNPDDVARQCGYEGSPLEPDYIRISVRSDLVSSSVLISPAQLIALANAMLTDAERALINHPAVAADAPSDDAYAAYMRAQGQPSTTTI